MQSKPRAPRANGYSCAPRAVIVAGLVALSMLLAGCEAGIQAAGKAGSLAQNQPPPATVTSLPASIGGWNEAGQVTVTPPASDSTPSTEADAAATAPAENTQAVQFAGPVESLPGTGDWSGPWQVAGRLVHVTSTTNMDQRRGRVAVGTRVAVEGWQQPDGSVDAGWIIVLGATGTATPTANPAGPATATPGPATAANPPIAASPGQSNDQNNEQDNEQGDGSQPVRPIEFRGTVEKMPTSGLVGTWRISGRTVNVNARTRVQEKQGALAIGAYVQVMGWQQPDGSINAAMIQPKKINKGNNGLDNQNGDNPGNGKGNGNGNGKGHK